MQNINFNDGYKELSINNDPNRVIRFNPSDYGLLERFHDARKTMVDAISTIGKNIEIKTNGEAADSLEDATLIIKDINNVINEQMNYIFNADVAQVVFGKQSPISTIKGKYLFERFLDAVAPYMEKEIKAEQEASQKRINKYTKQVK